MHKKKRGLGGVRPAKVEVIFRNFHPFYSTSSHGLPASGLPHRFRQLPGRFRPLPGTIRGLPESLRSLRWFRQGLPSFIHDLPDLIQPLPGLIHDLPPLIHDLQGLIHDLLPAPGRARKRPAWRPASVQ